MGCQQRSQPHRLVIPAVCEQRRLVTWSVEHHGWSERRAREALDFPLAPQMDGASLEIIYWDSCAVFLIGLQDHHVDRVSSDRAYRRYKIRDVHPADVLYVRTAISS